MTSVQTATNDTADPTRRRPGRHRRDVHPMTNTAVTDATFDIDGGQQFVQG
jgi:hypothetical protein